MIAILLALAASGVDPSTSLGVRRDTACDGSGADTPAGWHYAVTPRLRSMTFPTRIADELEIDGSEVNGRLAYFRAAPSFGIVLHEFVPKGPIGFCAGGIVVGGGGRATTTGAPPGTYRLVPGSGYDGSTSAAQLSFDIGPDALQAEIMGWVAGFYGFRLGLGIVHAITPPPLRTPVSPGTPLAKFLELNGASGITSSPLRIDLNNVIRYAVSWPGGLLEVMLDVPVMDLILGGATAIGLLPADPTWRWIYLFGRPRASLALTQALGPLYLRGELAVPTELIVVPWYFADMQLAVQAGLVL